MTSIAGNCILFVSMTNGNEQRVTLFLSLKLFIQKKAKAVLEKISLTELVQKAFNDCLPEEIVTKKSEN